MSEKCCTPENGNFREAVCIHTDKVYDSCRDKDCLENIRVYLTACGQDIVDRAINIKCTKAEIIWVFSDQSRSKYNYNVKKKRADCPFKERRCMLILQVPQTGKMHCLFFTFNPMPKKFSKWVYEFPDLSRQIQSCPQAPL